jgi:endonuclease-8
MPEGDTILRAARRLARVLAGKRVAHFASPLAGLADAGIAGRRVDAVAAIGKNLIIHFDDGRALHTHMRMNGAWHLYRPGERWQKPAFAARVVIEVEARDAGADADAAFVAVCFDAPVVRLLAHEIEGAPADRELTRLGPDVLRDDFDAPEALRRLRALGPRPIGEALLVQSALAGIGNIYKSESLFAQRIDPFAPVSALDDAALAGVVAEARRMMLRNVAPAARTRTTTRALGPRYAVYRRAGLPCPACGGLIAMRRQGEARRSTYYCPRCQRTA